jgi:ssRNA-specific RNase YbeY (16S rRNA maturation enzyme)
MISVISPSRYKVNKKQIKTFASNVMLENGIVTRHAVNIVFAGKKKLKDLSQKYKHENVALPVLTFVYNEPSDGQKYLGEVLICYPQAVLLAAQKNKTVEETIIKLVKHGLDNIIKNL